MLEAVRKFLQKNLEWNWDGAGLLFFFFLDKLALRCYGEGQFEL